MTDKYCDQPRKVKTCTYMVRVAFSFRLLAATAALFAGVLLFSFGGSTSAYNCAEEASQRLVPKEVGEPSTAHSAISLSSPFSIVEGDRLSSLVVPGSPPDCGPRGPFGERGIIATRPVRLTERADCTSQWVGGPTIDSGRSVSMKTVDTGQQSNLSPFVSHAQGTLGTVRSVVLRL